MMMYSSEKEEQETIMATTKKKKKKYVKDKNKDKILILTQWFSRIIISS